MTVKLACKNQKMNLSTAKRHALACRSICMCNTCELSQGDQHGVGFTLSSSRHRSTESEYRSAVLRHAFHNGMPCVVSLAPFIGSPGAASALSSSMQWDPSRVVLCYSPSTKLTKLACPLNCSCSHLIPSTQTFNPNGSTEPCSYLPALPAVDPNHDRPEALCGLPTRVTSIHRCHLVHRRPCSRTQKSTSKACA